MHHLTALIAATLAFSSIDPALAAGSEYPARPVRMIVPYPPGGGSDITGRAIGAKLGNTSARPLSSTTGPAPPD